MQRPLVGVEHPLSGWVANATSPHQLPSHLIDQRPELINILKTPIDTGKAYVGYLVELFQLAHDQLANTVGGDFTHPQAQELFFDAFYGAVNLFGTHGALAQGQVHGAEDFKAFVLDAAAVFFDDRRKRDVRPFVGGEPFFTRAALAAATYEVCVF
jgi:hypothetical protein